MPNQSCSRPVFVKFEKWPTVRPTVCIAEVGIFDAGPPGDDHQKDDDHQCDEKLDRKSHTKQMIVSGQMFIVPRSSPNFGNAMLAAGVWI